MVWICFPPQMTLVVTADKRVEFKIWFYRSSGQTKSEKICKTKSYSIRRGRWWWWLFYYLSCISQCSVLLSSSYSQPFPFLASFSTFLLCTCWEWMNEGKLAFISIINTCMKHKMWKLEMRMQLRGEAEPAWSFLVWSRLTDQPFEIQVLFSEMSVGSCWVGGTSSLTPGRQLIVSWWGGRTV